MPIEPLVCLGPSRSVQVGEKPPVRLHLRLVLQRLRIAAGIDEMEPMPLQASRERLAVEPTAPSLAPQRLDQLHVAPQRRIECDVVDVAGDLA